MSVQEKYQSLVDLAKNQGVTDLKVNEQEGTLYVTGTAPTAEAKDAIWDAYEAVDPEMRAGDLVLDITLPEGVTEPKTYVVKPGDSLSKIAKLFPGVSWNDIFKANKDQIKDPNLIHPGQELKIPG